MKNYRQELWKDIKGYEGRYQVSNLGNVKSLPLIVSVEGQTYRKHKRDMPGTQLAKHKSNKGYYLVSLQNPIDKSLKSYHVHRLVMEHHRPQMGGERNQVNHIDGNKLNNELNNLEWVTASENIIHARATGLVPRYTAAEDLDEMVVFTNGKQVKMFHTMGHAARYFAANYTTLRRRVIEGSNKPLPKSKWRYIEAADSQKEELRTTHLISVDKGSHNYNNREYATPSYNI